MRMNIYSPVDRFYIRILEHNEIVNRYSVAQAIDMLHGLWPKRDTAAFAKTDG